MYQVNKDEYRRAKRSINFEYRYRNRRIDFVRDIAFSLRKKEFENNPVQYQGISLDFRTYVNAFTDIKEEDLPNYNLCNYLENVIKTGNIELAGEQIEADLNTSFGQEEAASAQKAARLFRFLLEAETFSALARVYETLVGGANPVISDMQIDPNMPSSYSIFTHADSEEGGIAYSTDVDKSVAVLFQDVSTPQKVLSFLREPLQISQEDAITLIWDWYITGAHSTAHPITLSFDRRNVYVHEVPPERTMWDNFKASVAANNFPVFIWDEHTLRVPWVNRVFQDSVFEQTAGRKSIYCKPMLQNGFSGRKLQPLSNELDNNLRQYDLSEFLRNSNLSHTLQWFVLCTKLSALTYSGTQEILPARFRKSIIDKKVDRETMWKLIAKLAPNSFSAVNVHHTQKLNKNLPTWQSILESIGFNLRF